MKSIIILLLCLNRTVSAEELTAGTSIEIRLKTKVASNASKAHDPIEATVIKPVMSGERFLIPYGAVLRGQVTKAEPAPANGERAILALHFDQLAASNGKSIKLDTKLTAV